MNYLAIENLVLKALDMAGPLQFHPKEDGSLVSNKDIFVSSMLEVYLQNMFPDCVIIDEENSVREIPKNTKHVFVVDPIDGSENFISGSPIWGVSIAHYTHGRCQDALILLPDLRKSIGMSTYIERSENSRIVALSSYLNPDEIKAAAPKNEHEEYRIYGASVYNCYAVITGQCKRYENPRINSWDILAGINIAKENGVPVKINGENYNGEFLRATEKYHVILGE